MTTTLKVYDDANVACGFVTKAFYAFNFFLADKVGDFDDEVGLVDAIWNCGNYNLALTSLCLNDFGNTTHNNAATTSRRRMMNIFFIKSDTA